jgi:hypothetical protein
MTRMLGSPSTGVGSRRLAGFFVGLGLSGYLLLAVSASTDAGAGGTALVTPSRAQAKSVAVAVHDDPLPSFDPGRTASDLLEGPAAWTGDGVHRIGLERDLASLRRLPPPSRLRTPLLPAGFIPDHSNAPPLAG